MNDLEECDDIGKDVIRNNHYAVLLLAGGLGSRLGISYPKGCLELNVNGSRVSIFELFVKQLEKANLEFGSRIRLYIMTSSSNDRKTRKFFEVNNYFGYDKNDIFFFVQNELPILDIEGNMVLKSKGEVLFGPNGNGDVFSSLKDNGLINDMVINGIEYVLFTIIDNVLANLVDCRFIGATIKNNYKLSSKTIMKENEVEKDWVFCKYDNKPFVLPSNYISLDITNKKDLDGNYLYREKNVVCHLISVDYIKKFSNINLKYHRAYKKNSFLNEDGVLEGKDSFKFERFLFDAFFYADDMLLYRIPESDFCKIKSQSDIKEAEIKLENR